MRLKYPNALGELEGSPHSKRSAMKDGIISYTVEGRGEFPIDMLRYAQAWPQTPDDAAAITNTMIFYDAQGNRTDPVRKFRVRLNAVTERDLHMVTKRWESFGCRVENVNA